MSLFGSLDTAVGGMNAQSAALSSISDNVANSQTVGFKEVNTAFQDYVTQASSSASSPNVVLATPQYTNGLQGNVTQVTNTTALAVSGNGFFAVQQPIGKSSTGATTVNPQQYYTRTGDFSLNAAGNLVNSSGYVLDGTNGVITINKAPSSPVATTQVTMAANLPTTPSTDTVTTPYASTVQVFDADGNKQNLTLSWSQVGSVTPGGAISSINPAVPNEWNLTVTGGTPTAPATTTPTTGPMLVTFGATAATAGTIQSITAPATAGSIVSTVPAAATQVTGNPVTVKLPMTFGLGPQSIALNLGTFGSSSGITQFAGSGYQVSAQTPDGSAQGNYSSVTIKPSGDVVVNYDNGNTATVATVPLVTFANSDGLQMENGQAYTATAESGAGTMVAAGTGGSGTLTVGAVESSNVDIAAQFTQMIVAQQAYTANSKIITTSNQLLSVTINMIQG